MTPLIMGLGSSEILILIVLIVILIVSPVMWFQERSKRKYWQAKAEAYEKKLIDKN